MGVGNKLKELLKKKNMTVAELSRESKISAQTLYSIINRDSNISFDNAIIIASILDIDYFELVDVKNSNIEWMKRDRDHDDISQYGDVKEYSFDESINYMLDSHTKFTAFNINRLIQEFQYEISYNNGSFILSNNQKSISIKRDDVEFIHKKVSEYTKNLIDSITNNELTDK